MSHPTESDGYSSSRQSIEIEKQNLLESGLTKPKTKKRFMFSHVGTLYAVIGFLCFMIGVMARELWRKPKDPSMQVYCKYNFLGKEVRIMS